MTSIKQISKEYLDQGFVSQPLKGKRPVVKGWQKLNKDRCLASFRNNNTVGINNGQFNIGILTGKVSGIIVLDIDHRDFGVSSWNDFIRQFGDPQTVAVKTGSHGFHYYFKYDSEIKQSTGIKYRRETIGWDIKSDGGQVVAPPSIYPGDPKDLNKQKCRGNPYKWIRSPNDYSILEVPDWLERILKPDIQPLPKEIQRKTNTNDDDTNFIIVEDDDEDVEEIHNQTSEIVPSTCSLSSQKVYMKILDCFSLERWDSQSDWINIAYALFRSPGNENMRKMLWNEYSKKSDKFVEGEPEKKWEYIREGANNVSDQRKLKFKHLLDYARTDNKEQFEKEVWYNYNLYEGEYGHSLIVTKELSGRVVIINTNGDGYIWNNQRKLWLYANKKFLVNMIPEVLLEVHDQYVFLIQNSKYKTKEIQEDKLKVLRQIKANIQKYSHSNNVFNYLIKPGPLYDDQFEKKINAVPHLLPIHDQKVIDLRDGKVRERKKDDYFSFVCPVTDKGDWTNEKVVKFVSDIMNNNEQKIHYLQSSLGYCISGETKERCLFIMYGEGSNGKTQLLKLVESVLVLGQFCQTVSKDIFIKTSSLNRHRGAATPYLIPLIGSRFCTFSETDRGEELNEGLLKMITGCDTISARPLYGSQLSFKPFCKLAMITNNKPTFNIEDQAMIDRLHFISFPVRFVDKPSKPNEKLRDNSLVEDIMKNHLDDFFAWIVEGSKRYYSEGLHVPSCISKAKSETIGELDFIQQFLDEKTQKKRGAKVKTKELYQTFEEWFYDNIGNDDSAKCPSIRQFNTSLRKKNFDIVKNNNIYYILCIVVLE